MAHQRKSTRLNTSLAVVMTLLAVIGLAARGVHGQGTGQPVFERFVLSGVLVLEGGAGMAWLREPSLTGDRVVVLRPGERVGPYRLTKILEDRVELEGPTGKVLLPIYDGLRTPGTAVASAAPEMSRPVPSPGPPAATVPDPTAAARLDTEIATAVRARVELARQQAQSQQVLQQQQVRQPVPDQQGQQHVDMAPPGIENPFANNPDVIFIPQGDPRRREGLQSLFGGGR
jgi:hypothetical protein